MPESIDNEREERVCVSGRSNDSEVFVSACEAATQSAVDR